MRVLFPCVDDHTRVILKNGRKSDYINANYVDVSAHFCVSLFKFNKKYAILSLTNNFFSQLFRSKDN